MNTAQKINPWESWARQLAAMMDKMMPCSSNREIAFALGHRPAPAMRRTIEMAGPEFAYLLPLFSGPRTLDTLRAVAVEMLGG